MNTLVTATSAGGSSALAAVDFDDARLPIYARTEVNDSGTFGC